MLGNGKCLGVVKHPGSKKSTSLTVAAEPYGAGAGVVVAAHAGGVFLCSGPQRGVNKNTEGIADPVGAGVVVFSAE